MEFVNLTPFGAAAYRGVDVHDNEYDVVVARTVYRLHAAAQPGPGPTWLVAEVIDDEAPDLITEDQYSTEVGQSSVRVESDLAPFKPRCDVIVSGHTFAPGGKPCDGWLARLRVSQPTRHPQAADTPDTLAPLNAEDAPSFAERVRWQQAQEAHRFAWNRAPGPQGERTRKLLLDKTLRVHAPRRFELTLWGGWQLRGGSPVAKVPLLYERAYGGASVVVDPRASRDTAAPLHLLNEVNYSNPLGCGWWHRDHLVALKDAGLQQPDHLPAPQFEYPDDPVKAPDFTAQAAGLAVTEMGHAGRAYAHRPAGFGPLGRAWTPRVQAAGSYDARWLQERWPNLPEDFDMGYWCCAPADQQMPFPAPDMYLELGNLIEPRLCPSGHALLQLPGHRTSALFRLQSGLLVGGPCVIDTLALNTDTMQLSLTWRASLACTMAARVAELRFEVDALKPLLGVPPAAETPPQPSAGWRASAPSGLN